MFLSPWLSFTLSPKEEVIIYGRGQWKRGGGHKIWVQAVGGGGQNFNAQLQRGAGAKIFAAADAALIS